MDDIQLARLGDKFAQDRMTNDGKPLPCRYCGGYAILRYTSDSDIFGCTCNIYKPNMPGFVVCRSCGNRTQIETKICTALKKWNARPEIMGLDELKELEGRNEYFGGICYGRS